MKVNDESPEETHIDLLRASSIEIIETDSEGKEKSNITRTFLM